MWCPWDVKRVCMRCDMWYAMWFPYADQQQQHQQQQQQQQLSRPKPKTCQTHSPKTHAQPIHCTLHLRLRIVGATHVTNTLIYEHHTPKPQHLLQLLLQYVCIVCIRCVHDACMYVCMLCRSVLCVRACYCMCALCASDVTVCRSCELNVHDSECGA